MGEEITGKMKIGDLVLNYPSSVEVLFNHGFHCVGCSLSAEETLEDGARAHGYSEEEIAEIIGEVKEAAKKDIENAGKLDRELKAAKTGFKSAGGLKIAPKEAEEGKG